MFKRPEYLTNDRNNGLNHIQGQLKLDRALKQIVLRLLPPALAPHCHYCTLRGTTLVMYTSSSVWASRLLYQRNTILEGLKTSGCDRCRMMKTCVLPQQQPRKQARMPVPKPQVADLIQQCSDDSADLALKQSLFNLARALRMPRRT